MGSPWNNGFCVALAVNRREQTLIEPLSSHLLGGAAALASAFLWAVSAILFRRVGDAVSAMGINLAKGLVALACMAALLLPTGLAGVDPDSLTALAISGLVGITLGDTLYFMTLVRLGPRRTLLVGALIPVVTALIAAVMLGERVPLLAWLGMALTITGVTTVLWQRSAEADRGQGKNGVGKGVEWRRSGLFFALLFVFANALGIIASKLGVADMPALEATFIRQAFAIAGLTFWGLMLRDLLGWVRPLRDVRLLKPLLLAALIGAFLGTWLSIVALKYTYVAVAATLNSTSPLFILPLAAVMMGERIRVREVLGAATAVAGVGLYFVSLG